MQGKVIRDAESGEIQCVIMNSGVSADNLQLLVKRILSVAVCYCSVALLFAVCVAFVVCCVCCCSIALLFFCCSLNICVLSM